MTQATLGVVVVTYCGADVIATCLETLMGARDVALRVVVVDNGSPDDTVQVIKDWASGVAPFQGKLPFIVSDITKPVPLDGTGGGHRITLIETGRNTGFAGGVNVGLAHLAADPAIDRFWVLNPDCAVPPETPAKLATATGDFALMGNRIIFQDDPDMIQIDGGLISWTTGVTANLNTLQDPATTPTPAPDEMQFISGASMVASRAFYESVGPMREDYFLYYEEVDWALRRTAPLAWTADAPVYHKGGASIGSRTRRQRASVLSLYFIHRARVMFLWRFRKASVPMGLAYSLAKSVQLFAEGDAAGAAAILRGSFQMRAPKVVRQKLGH
ncbi:MAG: glycosyltransferase family 2 protein [Pseudomonadota bacterium]